MIKKLGLYMLVVLIATGCSSSKWVVTNQNETDRNDFELLESVQFLQRTGTTSPQNPFVQFDLKASNTFEYVQRVRTDRYIQRYRLSLKSMALGIIGAGIATGTALVSDANQNTQKVLFGTAGFITLASFLNMNPSGEAAPTGETRLLRRTGTIVETDSVASTPIAGNTISFTIYDEDEILAINDDIPFQNNRYTINLLEAFNPDNFIYETDHSLTLEVLFNDEFYVQQIPLSSFLERFVVVETEISALRDEPELSSRTILTNLAKGSQLQLVSEDSLWYKVLYGISETYIARSDASLIWRPSQFANQLSIIAVPNIPFGNVDVESNIPTISPRNTRKFAFLVANREYQGDYSERSYAERDAQLIEEYLKTAYGIPTENLQKNTNLGSQQQLVLAYNRFANSIRSQQKQLTVYVSGYVKAGEDEQMILIGTGEGGAQNPINLNSFFSGISRLPVEELIVYLDIDNVDMQSETGIIERLATQILVNNSNSAIIVSSTENQRSRNYSVPNGDQNRHSIFTYFIADAMKKGASTVAEVVNHLQRNVDYTSRRLHNEPQHVLFFGKNDIRLTD